jgi:glycosyltransferase involved in cell wall biosynthesis
MASDLQGREAECEQGLRPRHHLWGLDSLKSHGYDVKVVSPTGTGLQHHIGRRIAELTRRKLGDPERELKVLEEMEDADAIYVVSHTDIFWLSWLRSAGLIRSKIVTWYYTPAPLEPIWKPLGLRHSPAFLRGLDGILCLTEATASNFRVLAPHAFVRKVDWGADLDMFTCSPSQDGGHYFLSCGRTERDFETLFRAAEQIDFPVHLIAPRNCIEGLSIPSNVRLLGGPEYQLFDNGLTYHDLVHKHYTNARAVLIPRQPVSGTTSGFTNLLEALAMSKPVIITRTGCLDLDVEKEEVGFFVEPRDVSGWVKTMNLLAGDADKCLIMGRKGRQLAEQYYNYERFGRDICDYFDTLLKDS